MISGVRRPEQREIAFTKPIIISIKCEENVHKIRFNLDRTVNLLNHASEEENLIKKALSVAIRKMPEPLWAEYMPQCFVVEELFLTGCVTSGVFVGHSSQINSSALLLAGFLTDYYSINICGVEYL